MAKCIAVFVLMFGGLLFGQGNIQTVGAGAPSNPCAGGQEYVNSTNGDLYSCSGADNTWRLHGNRGSNISSGAFGGGTAGNSYQDVTEIAAPANPASGNERVYADSTAHTIKCLTSSGGSCLSSGGGSVAGSDKDVQINKSAAFGVDTGNFVFDYTNHRLGVNTGGESPTFNAGFQYGNGATLAYTGAFANASVLSDANSHHLWAEESQWNPTSAAAGMAAFNTATVIGGSSGASHYASFQSAPICSVTGVGNSCGTLYGFYDSPTINGTGTGTINRQGLSVQAVTLSGGMSLSQNYGVYIAADTAGSSNWTIVADKTAHSYLAGCVAIAGVVDCGGNGSGLTVGSGPQFVVSSAGLVTKDDNLTTAGQGHGIILGLTSQKAETQAADANVLTVTPAAAAGTYRLAYVASVSSGTSGVISFTGTWKDSNGNTQTAIALPLFQLGTAAPNTTFTTSSAGNYSGELNIDVDSSATAIVIKWVGGGTSAAKVTASIERLN